MESLPRTDYAHGVIYAIAAGIALGTLGPVSNIAYGAGMTSPTFAALRATIGAAVLLVFLTVTHAERVSVRRCSVVCAGLAARAPRC